MLQAVLQTKNEKTFNSIARVDRLQAFSYSELKEKIDT
jgi:non-ribosomal peptide synthetase component E (peptide arylation enzyme)